MKNMKKYVIYLAVISLGIFSFTQLSSSISSGAENDSAGIQWITLEEAQKLNKENPKEAKKIMIDVYTDWCGPCKKMAKKTFTDEKVIKYVSENFHAVKFNAEDPDPLTFNGNVFVNKGRTHEFTNYLGVTGYPTISFFDTDNSPIMKFTAYLTAKEMEIVLKFINDEIYRKKTYEDFYGDQF
jgi:thioredoxin-related protein